MPSVLDTVHTLLSILLGYHYFITNYGNVQALAIIDWTLKAKISFNVVIIVMVQGLYALRMWKLARGHQHIILPMIAIGFVAVMCVTALVFSYFMLRGSNFEALARVPWSVIGIFAVATATDLVIAAVMCFYLHKSRSGFASTNSKLDTILQYTLCSGAATSAVSMGALIAYCVSPHTLIFLALEFCLTEVYINSFLAMLNARQGIGETGDSGVSVSLRDLHRAPTGPALGFVRVSRLSAKLSLITFIDQRAPSLADAMPYRSYGERKQPLSWGEEA
ncbi:hypothetical protein HWV62_43902 [Athelia sp. TMB]|nr:hypothetical protein HWV62_43902 [Athelia sp. TMB]